ncbi:MAG: hypothetical protein KDI83_17500 [Gammaproteobacteria bacterium]|nr:hypothetical protein [Gammaproteobacteria bacterium]
MSSISLQRQQHPIPGQPLWQRVPTRDESGRALPDFMMLIPKIGSWPEIRREQAINELRSVFARFEQRVVFADLNLKLNLLWITLRPTPDGCLSLVEAITAVVPEAKLVASQYEAMLGWSEGGSRRSRVRCGWFGQHVLGRPGKP